MKVSVIMAAFQAEQFVGKALQSLKEQTYSDFEAIIVDDCSTDGTPEIAQKFVDEDERFRLIRLTENGGQAKARNVALAECVGDFICFLDADDWLSADALEKAVETFAEYPRTDSVLFSVIMEYADHTEPFPMPDFDVLSGKEAFRLSLSWAIHGVYMTRAEIHKPHPYDTSARTYSDDNTTRIHYLLSREVRRCAGVYHYLQHEASATHKVSLSRFDYLRANESMLRQMAELGVEQSILDDFEHQRWMTLIDCCWFLYQNRRKFSRDEIEWAEEKIREYWLKIDHTKVKRPHRWKLGYIPLSRFAFFKKEEYLYFFLKSLKEKIFLH